MNFFLTIGLVFAVSLSACSYDNGIFDYIASRDEAAVLSMIELNMQLLNYQHKEDVAKYVYDIVSKPKKFYKVMRQAGKTIGHIFYVYREPYACWRINTIVVDQNFRRSGCATAMMQFAIDDMIAMGAKKITMFVRVDNMPARILYTEKFGFHEFERILDNTIISLVLYV